MSFPYPAGSTTQIRTLDDADLAGRRVLARVDFNVPLASGRVTDDTRIRAALPTIEELLGAGASVILMSHLGRPKGPDDALRMAPVGERLADLLGRPVATTPHVVDSAAASALAPEGVLLLENLRFDPGEKANAPELCAALAAMADLYVNDAFGTAHRADASTEGVAHLLPAYAGRLMELELRHLGTALHAPARPFVAVLGGAKVSDKMGVLRHLLPRADRVLVGGGMANTFLLAQRVPMAESLAEPERVADAAELLAAHGERLGLPSDLVVADALAAGAATRTVTASEGVPHGWRALDIGPATRAAYAADLASARTVVWNGPMGVFETPPFDAGTVAVARAVAGLEGATTIVGGGDSIAAIAAAGVTERIGWISTGGGAMLALLAGERLPAVDALARE